MSTPQPQHPEERAGTSVVFSRSPVTLADLLEGLLWPKLLRAAGLALNPGRIWLASFLIVAVFALDTTWRSWFGGRTEPGPMGPLISSIADIRQPAGTLYTALLPHVQNGAWVWSPDLQVAGRALLDLFITVPTGMIVTPDGSVGAGIAATLVLLPISVLILAVIGGAICRSVAVEFSTGAVIPWTRALGFAISRWGSLFGAVVGPVLVVWGVCLLMLGLGWLMKWPVLNLVGGVFFPIVLLLSLLASLFMAAYVMGQMMLIPAVACDGADGFDAVQRAYAYTYGRPLRLVGYLLILLLAGTVASVLLASFASLTLALAERTTGITLDAPSAAAGEVDAAGTVSGWLERATRLMVGFWSSIVRIAVAAYVLSFYFAGSTVVYLIMRKLNDDQDLRDVWMPGAVEGTVLLRESAESTPKATGSPAAAAPSTAATDAR